ncbi:MAG: FecR domain-containing protein [Spirochaetes bacterium]|nr:FecR domain-containing protein [Spirochaetota bacterium]
MKNGRALRIFVIAVIAALTVGILASCSRSSDRTVVTFYMGKVDVLRSGAALKPAVKMQINDGDVISTGPGAFILLQVADSTVIRIMESTTVEMKTLLSPKNRELIVKEGKALSAVKKLSKGDSYSAKTATLTASVRGTEYSVSARAGESVVAVRKGIVEVTVTGTAQRESVGEGKAFVYTDKAVIRAISDAEDKELEKIAAVPLIYGLEGKTEKEIRDILTPLLGRDAMPESTLVEMKAKYGRTDTVTLYDGRVLTGVILSRGAVYTILTTGGVITVPEKKIRNTRVQ